MGSDAAYLVKSEVERDAVNFVPEFSRRARGIPTYATLRTLGRQGVAELVERCCALARRMAERLAVGPGVRILNEVVLNQVLLRFEPGARQGRRRAHPRGGGPGAGGWHLLAGRQRVARPGGDARQRLGLEHHRGRHRPFGRGHSPLRAQPPARCRPKAEAEPPSTAGGQGAGGSEAPHRDPGNRFPSSARETASSTPSGRGCKSYPREGSCKSKCETSPRRCGLPWRSSSARMGLAVGAGACFGV